MKELKKYLTINSLFSAISGLTMLLFSIRLNDLFNIENSYIFPIIGANLLIFSIFVWYVASKQLTNKMLVTTITILDLLWVVGSFAIVFLGLFGISKTGNILISIVAIWIAFLAYKQFKNFKLIAAIVVLTVTIPQFAVAQEKLLNLKMAVEVNVPAKQLWQVLGENYGSIANITPHLFSSNLIDSISKPNGEGCERICTINKSGTKFIKEKMTQYDSVNMSFRNQIFQMGRVPLKISFATYKIVAVDTSHCLLSIDMHYRTKPAWIGFLVKGQFKRMTNDVAIYAEHYIKTGEKITKTNYKQIKRKYKKSRT
jgi:hypothetical protein